ncbi:MAG: orotidine-5'-phosphate decarboxylase [Clostridia bacterium]|nr:orotidine-5'-phosphate decarboxylase [Clostridia bacterium]
MIDRLIDGIKRKRNPCIVGIDPEWEKLPVCYRSISDHVADCILCWAKDVIDAVDDVVVAVKPQMAFFEVFGSEGIQAHQQTVAYAHEHGLLVIDDSKRNDIGNTAKAYATAHLAKDGPIDADFLTVNPFLGTDSLEPFLRVAEQDGKGLFILVKTSNPSSHEISDAIKPDGQTVCQWLAAQVNQYGVQCMGRYGYSSIGAVVGATYPAQAAALRRLMKEQFFLVPGYGAQGGNADSIAACFNSDGLGALISSSRGILYHYQQVPNWQPDREAYREDVRTQARQMQQDVYAALQMACDQLSY